MLHGVLLFPNAVRNKTVFPFPKQRQKGLVFLQLIYLAVSKHILGWKLLGRTIGQDENSAFY